MTITIHDLHGGVEGEDTVHIWRCDDDGCAATVDVAVGQRIPADWFIADVWTRDHDLRLSLSYCPRHGGPVRRDFARALSRSSPS